MFLYYPISFYIFKDVKSVWVLGISHFLGWALIKVPPLLGGSRFINIFFGLCRVYTLCFKVKGFGFRFVKIWYGLYVKLNFTHKIYILPFLGHKVRYRHKYKFSIKGRNIWLLLSSLAFFIFYLKKKVFKRLGIYLKGSIFKIKVSKKKIRY